MRKIITAAVVTLTLMACVSIDCPVNNLVQTTYLLQKPNGGPDTLGVDTLTVWVQKADQTDTTLINRLCGTKATRFSIPMSFTQPEDLVCTQLCDTSGHLWMDTIFVTKENSPHFEGVDCQASYFHKLTGIRWTHNMIDTVIINKTDVDYDSSTPHLLLRFKARR